MCVQAQDLEYLGYATAPVPKAVYLLFKAAKLLQSRDQLWEHKKEQMLAMPDPLLFMAAQPRQGLERLRMELEQVFSKYVQQGQIVFRNMPVGNKHVLRGFVTHFVIDVQIIGSITEVHRLLQASLGSDAVCQQPCQCPRQLLVSSMTDALFRQKGGPSKESIMHNVMGQYLHVSRYELHLPASSSSPSRHPNSAPDGQHASNAVDAGATVSATAPEQLMSQLHVGEGRNSSPANTPNADDTGLLQSPHHDQGQPTIRVVQDHDAPLVPDSRDPVLFHNGIKNALASILRSSAGQACQLGNIHTSFTPSESGSADTVTVRLCPIKSKHPMEQSNVRLESYLADDGRQLYFPVGFDYSNWTDADCIKVQGLYNLLEQLHELFLPGVASVNIYYDANDGYIAFNQGNKLWYNAFADRVYHSDQCSKGLRWFNWYLTVCHELAHNFQAEHNTQFSEYMSNIALQHSRGFYELCRRNHVDI